MWTRGGTERERDFSPTAEPTNWSYEGNAELRPTRLLLFPPQQENFAAFRLEMQQMIKNDRWKDGLFDTREIWYLRSAAVQLWQNSA